MSDTVLQFINPSKAPTLPTRQDHPVQRMHRCLDSARQIEQMAVQMDAALADRDATVAQFEKDYSQRTTQASQLCRKNILEADQARSSAKSGADLGQTRINDTVTAAFFHLKLTLSDWRDTHSQVQETADALENRLKSVYEETLRSKEDSEEFNNNFVKNRAVNVVVVMFYLLLSMGLFYFFNLELLVLWLIFTATLGALIWRGVSLGKVVQTNYGRATEIAQLLIQRSNFDHRQAITASQTAYDQSVTQAEAQLKQEEQQAAKQRDDLLSICRATCSHQWSDLMQKMESTYAAANHEIRALNQGTVRGNWSDQAWEEWEPAQTVPGCLRIGTVVADMPRFQHHLPNLPLLAVPALVDYEAGKGVVISAGGTLTEARQMAQSAILRLLATVPPASVRFVMIDPVSLGGNVAGFMALEKYEASLVGGKAWSDVRHIEQALTEVTEHMETVIQKYLREDYKSIAEYNAKARVKEAYRVIVIFDFPVNFTEGTAKRLISIMRNGPRCGVFPIIVADNTKPLPYGVSWKDLTQFAMVLQPSDAPAVVLADEAVPTRQGTAPSSQGVVNDYYDDDDEEEDEDE